MEDTGLDNWNVRAGDIPDTYAPTDQQSPSIAPDTTTTNPINTTPGPQTTESHNLASTTDLPTSPTQPPTTTSSQNGITDLGWHAPASSPHPPLLPDSLPNPQLWSLIRRFDKQVCHVKSLPTPPPSGLDLEIAEGETFTPVKFKTHLERLYMSLVVGAFTAWKHAVRLRSWQETKRTGAFCAVYAAAWAADVLGVVAVLWAMGLVMVPGWRAMCFPPAPPSMIRADGKGVKTPMAGVLASEGSVTGAPEKREGEAVEQEAHSFVNSVITLAVGLAGDQNPKDISETKYKTGGLRAVEQDKTKKPVTDMVFSEAEEVMHMMAQMIDVYERFANALNPTPPFPVLRPRLILASCLTPLLFTFLFFSSHMIVKSLGLLIGFAIFGDPLIAKGTDFLNRNYPGWKQYLSLRNTILKGVPTDSQLTLTLLRIGERNNTPIPPPPSTDEPPKFEGNADAAHNLDQTLGIDQSDINAAVAPDPTKKAEAEANPQSQIPKTKHRILNAVKGVFHGGVSTGLGADHLLARTGVSEGAKYREGVVRTGSSPESGPTRFPARWQGKKGYAVVDGGVVGWVSGDVDKGKEVEWELRIGGVNELQKIGGLGWKTKIAVAWATDAEINDGIILRDGEGKEYHLTAIPERDALFNRLVAIGEQIWEAW
ncbi:hypothetical protein QBC39DRAFT_44910 [Podospora conica]|nr:hypothetical protein QBC39DRAFT_44910 [Schizothecium conicum]